MNQDTLATNHRVAEILVRELRLEDVTADTFDADINLVEELGIDSMDMTTLVLVLQDEYKVKIDEEQYPKLKTVRAITDYVRELQSKS